MNTNRKIGLLALAVAAALVCGSASALTTATGDLTVDATLVTACEVNTGGAINFGSFNALESSGTKNADSGTTFQVACSADALAPAIFSATARTIGNGTDTLAFGLSFVSSGGASLPTATPGTAIGITQNGSMQAVTLYGQLLAADYKALSSGLYTADMTITVEW